MDRRKFLLKGGRIFVGGATVASLVGEAVESRSQDARGKDTPAGPIGNTDLSGTADVPIAIHPENSKYFLFRGRPLVLVAASEHYGSVVNRPFDFARYLADAAHNKQTLTRLFLLFRELQSPRNPWSPLKPESPDYIAPWPRTGSRKALDGEPIYDLDRWNPEYFKRLHQFLSRASELEIVVELVLFSNTYSANIWELNPLRAENNKQGMGKVEWSDYTSLRERALVDRQFTYVRKIVQETGRYDNVYYEICNEPGGGMPDHTTPAEVDSWQEEIARVVRCELHKLNRNHLVFGSQAFCYTPSFRQPLDSSFSSSWLDAVNVHPLPGMVLRGQTYQLGNFMSKELRLAEFRDFFLAVQRERKPCISDEDNAASLYRDETGWTIHRKRAWTAILSGAHYDYIDFSITVGSEAGTQESHRTIRRWIRHLSEFIHSFDFIQAQPAPGWIERKPKNLVDAVLARAGSEYIAYLADDREVSDPTGGQPIAGPIEFALPMGTYEVRLYSPTAGVYLHCLQVEGGRRVSVDLPPFQQDIIVRINSLASTG